MCGIAAIIGKSETNSKKLREILNSIIHRGERKYFNESKDFGKCIMGTNRLAIVGRETGRQPATSMTGRYACILNGEIYNFQDLKDELIKNGYTFLTNSDAEVLVNGFEHWGIDELLKRINGMYAFIIFDTKEENFVAARDILGIKPLYWANDSKGTYYFASEIKALSHLDEIEVIKMFPPAHYMQDGILKQYWQMPRKSDNTITEEDAVQAIRELFDNAVKFRVATDLPVAVYLSGGVDSTSVLATARKYNKDVTAIIVGNEKSSDKEFAIRYCKENNIKYYFKLLPSEEKLSSNIPEIIRIVESFEPNVVRQSSIMYHIAELAAEHNFKVILCGEGADEIFAGYPEFITTKSTKEREDKIRAFLSDLHRTQLQRVDRISMSFTTEVRVPFLDREFVEYALRVPASFKVKQEDGKAITKYIFRKAMKDRLPDYISNREKVVLSEGAGFKGNQPTKGGLFYDIVSKHISDNKCMEFQNKYPDWNLKNKDEVYYFEKFLGFGYHKARFNKERIVANAMNTTDNET